MYLSAHVPGGGQEAPRRCRITIASFEKHAQKRYLVRWRRALGMQQGLLGDGEKRTFRLSGLFPLLENLKTPLVAKPPAHSTPHRAPVGQGPSGPGWLATQPLSAQSSRRCLFTNKGEFGVRSPKPTLAVLQRSAIERPVDGSWSWRVVLLFRCCWSSVCPHPCPHPPHIFPGRSSVKIRVDFACLFMNTGVGRLVCS